jgi:hypothetical protein
MKEENGNSYTIKLQGIQREFNFSNQKKIQSHLFSSVYPPHLLLIFILSAIRDQHRRLAKPGYRICCGAAGASRHGVQMEEDAYTVPSCFSSRCYCYLRSGRNRIHRDREQDNAVD